MNNGKLIVFEGGEGCGKSTQIKLLHKSMEYSNISSCITREPGGVVASEEIRSIILNNTLDAKTDLLLFVASRRENIIQNIIPNLQKKDYVICDRFLLSTIVYQCLLNNMEIEDLLYLHKVYNFNLFPHITIIYNVDSKIAQQRIIKRGNLSKIDKKSLDFHDKINSFYQASHPKYQSKCVHIDSSGDIYETHLHTINTINSALNTNIKHLDKLQVEQELKNF